ncbi:MAG: tRNA (adenosine(37)-N6)-dimethylallyltransferase MiaA [Puniceicoccales bacterium]|jgi:tRNA dimethylallyltransferase|nr:tRNA (adenosine(37)-N6)-dimethylallyltransferase MiaA [Puniceicoccales bacterium]
MVRQLVLIAGPTGSGKTALSLFLGERLAMPILCCDSLQVYRSMDIGTAKVSSGDRIRVPHYGLDLVDPWECYNVRQFYDYAVSVANGLNGPMLCVGGSSFYLQMFHGPVCDSIAIENSLRERVRQILDSEGINGLLRELDSRGGGDFPMDRSNPRRVARALERCMATGEPPSVALEKFRNSQWAFETVKVFTVTVEAAGSAYGEALLKRIDHMLSVGLVEETEELRRVGFERNPSACGAIGYAEALAFIDGKLAKNELPNRIFIRTKQLARKQRCWIRHKIPSDLSTDGRSEDWERVAEKIRRFLNP